MVVHYPIVDCFFSGSAIAQVNMWVKLLWIKSLPDEFPVNIILEMEHPNCADDYITDRIATPDLVRTYRMPKIKSLFYYTFFTR
jgi:hypothetical protein